MARGRRGGEEDAGPESYMFSARKSTTLVPLALIHGTLNLILV